MPSNRNALHDLTAGHHNKLIRISLALHIRAQLNISK